MESFVLGGSTGLLEFLNGKHNLKFLSVDNLFTVLKHLHEILETSVHQICK